LYFAQAAGQLTLLAVAMIMSRVLSRQDYGTLSQVFMIAAMGGAVLHMGTSQGIGYFFPRLDAPSRRALATQMSVYLALAGVALGATAYLASDALSRAWGNPALASVMKVASIWIACQVLPLLTPMALIATKHPKLGAIAPTVMTSISRAAIPVAYLLTRSLERTFLIGAAFAAVQFLLSAYLIVIYPYRGVSFPSVWPSVRDVADKCVPLGATALVSTAGLWLDKIFISTYYEPAQFAVFRNGAYEIPLLAMLSASVFTVVLPRMSELAGTGDLRATLTLWKQAAEKCALAMVPVAVFFVVFSTDAMRFLFGPKYVGSGPVFRIYSIGIIVRVAVYSQLFVAIGRTRIVTLAAVGALLANAGGNFLMLWLIGFVGPAVATIGANYIQALILLAVAARFYRAGFAEVFPWRKLLRIGVAAGLAVAAASILLFFSMPSLLRLIVGFGVMTVVYAPSAVLTRAVTVAELRSAVRQFRELLAKHAGAQADVE